MDNWQFIIPSVTFLIGLLVGKREARKSQMKKDIDSLSNYFEDLVNETTKDRKG
jgi:hypothetical protein